MSTISTSSTERASRSLSGASSLVQHGAALVFGVMILFAVGFLPMSFAHNAAHDTRHSFVFPCH
ncbi:CbtB domain-containing protein [Marinobacter sp. BGYM27]|uniref:CbtB domain-containing protein n=1 Tax=Marinobacter sp. BGYM27 TaxID=2975597 RepID=UPI0021A4145F|nr:CbtB domain-containing protein [Marinobacter sp. BGYM27]MDG5499141.1 CbtB-domain containing protein [Marinobacter sp. BGYM27]